MMTILAEPYKCAVEGPSCLNASMLKAICRMPPCSQPALSGVHHRLSSNIGPLPEAPKMYSAGPLGPRKLKPDPPESPPDATSVNAYMTKHRPKRNGMNAASPPSA